MKSYIRFGKMPSGKRSVNFNRMSIRENETFTELVNGGYTLEEAVIAAVGKEKAEHCLEAGISVFETDTDGLPKIDNLQQAMSLAARIGRETYICTGEEVGIGQDDEPLIIPESVEEVQFSTADLTRKIESVLQANYRCAIATDPADYDKIQEVYSFYYFDFSGKEHRYPDNTRFIFFNGTEYTEPVETWNDKTGADRK